jgi:hypothetical protein
VKLGNVSLDGTKLEANASKHKAMSHKRMLEEERRLQEKIAGLLKAAETTHVATNSRPNSDAPRPAAIASERPARRWSARPGSATTTSRTPRAES